MSASDDEDAVDVGPHLAGGSDDDEDAVQLGAPCSPAGRGRVGRGPGRPRPLARHGSFGAFLVATPPERLRADAEGAGPVFANRFKRQVLGVGRIEWTVTEPVGLDPAGVRAARVPIAAPAEAVRPGTWASLKYELVESWPLVGDGCDIPDTDNLDAPGAALELAKEIGALPVGPASSVAELLASLQFPVSKCVYMTWDDIKPAIDCQEPCVIRTVPLGGYIDYALFINGVPSRADVARMRRDAGASRAGRRRGAPEEAEDPVAKHTRLYEGALLELPPPGPKLKRAAKDDVQRPGPAKFNRTKDPVKTLHALAFSNLLRNTADLGCVEEGTDLRGFR